MGVCGEREAEVGVVEGRGEGGEFGWVGGGEGDAFAGEGGGEAVGWVGAADEAVDVGD